MSGVFCNQCGHRNPAGSNFCSSCGSALEVGEDHTVTFQAVEAPGEPAAEEPLTVSVGELPEPGAPATAGAAFSEVESTKSVSDV